MRMSPNSRKNHLLFLILVTICFGLPNVADAAVEGPCVNCHTMHNSQAGTTMANGTAYGQGGYVSLLRDNCIGCHSSATNLNVVTVGGSTTPIVFNTATPPAQELPGGNFSWVVANEGHGHNVAGLSAVDTKLNKAPGGQGACANSCHVSLVSANLTAINGGKTGCEGCHLYVGHHDEPSQAPSNPGPTIAAGGMGDAFRFLGGHGDVKEVANAPLGLKDGRYEGGYDKVGALNKFGADSADFNIYEAEDVTVDIVDPISMNRFCSGCHNKFHSAGLDTAFGPANGGDLDSDIRTPGNWTRHPTAVYLPFVGPGAGEFADILAGVPYDFNLPLARGNPNRVDNISDFDQVICITCHKAHGSQFADSLRFSYNGNNSLAHSGANRSTGCFFCHRDKDK